MYIITNLLLLITKKIEGIKQSDKTPLSNYISRANSNLTYKIGSSFIIMYYDENKLVLPAYSFPARAVVNNIGIKV